MTKEIILEIAGHEIKLDRKCYVCDEGVLPPSPESQIVEECSNCNGTGYAPTERGKLILEFIRRHM